MTDAPPPTPDPAPPPAPSGEPPDGPTRDRPDEPVATDDLVFETLWGRVLDAWDDDKPHNAVLDYALRAQKLPELAGRYRALTLLKGDAQKAERAKKRIDVIVLAATELMLSTKSPPLQRPPPAITLTAFAVAAALLALLAWLVFGPH